jgi:hypothetical protein
MSKETILIECPCCGALVGPEKFSKPHKFKVVKRIMAGKVARTEAEKILLKGVKTGRGSAHGNIRYELQPDFVHEIYKPIVDNAIKRVLHVKE